MTLSSAFSSSLSSLFGDRKPDIPAPLPVAPVKAPTDCTVITLNREERVQKAFADMPANEGEARALRALLDHPGSTGPQLSRICGWMDAGWMTQMIMLCQRRRRFLSPGGVDRDTTNGIIISALSDYDAETLQFCPRETMVQILREAVETPDIPDLDEAV